LALSRRAMLSCEPPGVNGQTMRTLREGQSSPWAKARPANGNAPSVAANWRLLMPCSLVLGHAPFFDDA
jgi:hypothetical protein